MTAMAMPPPPKPKPQRQQQAQAEQQVQEQLRQQQAQERAQARQQEQAQAEQQARARAREQAWAREQARQQQAQERAQARQQARARARQQAHARQQARARARQQARDWAQARQQPKSDGADGGRGGDANASGGGGFISGDGVGLSALMDQLLGNDTGRPLAEAGPACARVVEALGAPEAGQSFLAGVFWWLFTHSEAYKYSKKSLRASRRARPIVVSHAEGTRFDLLLLDPRRRRIMAALPLERVQSFRRLSFSDLHLQRLDNLIRRSRLDRSLESDTLAESAQELAASSRFGVAIVNAPREVPTCALSPAVPLHSASKDSVATLGSFLINVDEAAPDTCLATTANHALGRRSRTLTIDGVALEVVRRHNRSDSCLVRVHRSLLEGRQQRGLAGPLHSTPSLYSDATFDGAASGVKRTRIKGFDIAIVDPQPDEMCRVYTDADTASGDSGAALIGENDFIVGFAWRRSGYGASVEFSSWVWAEQVYLAHRLS
jgi:hypothetical protein